MDHSAERLELAYTDLNFRDVVRFFSARRIKVQCECCGENDWSTHDQSDQSVPSIFYTHRYDDKGKTRGFAAVYMMTCLNCANMRIFNREVIAGWIKKNPRATGDE